MNAPTQPLHRRAGIYLKRKWRWWNDELEKRWFRRIGWRHFVASARAQAAPNPSELGDGRLYIDISVISQNDARTGIQRVVRAVAGELALNPRGLMPVFVYCRDDKHYVVRLDNDGYSKTERQVAYKAGDIFLGLDFSLDALWRMRSELRRMRARGVKFWYLVHDLLPLDRPEWFSNSTVLRFYNWLAVMAGTADGFLCVSQPVAKRLGVVMAQIFQISLQKIHVIPMGWDLDSSRPTKGVPYGFERLVKQIKSLPSLLIVGTIEPRKGHKQALNAIQLLWQKGVQCQLVLVGGEGWKTDDLVAELRKHPEQGKRLHWLGKISDEALNLVYSACDGVLFPSFAEGFGLPVVEALGHRKPVLARNLDVLRGHSGKGVTLFDYDIDDKNLAAHIEQWLIQGVGRETVRPDLLDSWKATADFICDRLLDAGVERSQ